jgi:hypothetical protein
MSVANRVVLCAAVCVSLTACPKSDVARPLERPAPPTHGLADARVLFVDGNVEVTPPEGAPFAAKVGTDLVADDRIGASTSSKIVVVLRNGHAVRIDDASALKVRDIVLFQAPPTERPVDEQLKELMDAGESLPLDDVRERAAAWRHMLRAAETAGAESRADIASAAAATESAKSVAEEPAMAPAASSDEAKADAAAPKRVSERNAPATPPPPSATEIQPEADSDGLGGLGLRGTGPGGGGAGGSGLGGIGTIGGGGGGGGGGGYGTKARESARDDEQAEKRMKGEEGKMGKKDAPKSSAEASDRRAQILDQLGKDAGVMNSLSSEPAPLPPLGFATRFGASAAEAQNVDVTPAFASMASELGTCVGRSLPANVSLSTVDLLIEVRDGRAKRVRSSGALPVPLCARSVAVENAAIEVASTRGGSGWIVVTVPLSR